MGTSECSQPASESSWERQDFGDINMVLKMARFRKSTGPRWFNLLNILSESDIIEIIGNFQICCTERVPVDRIETSLGCWIK